MVRARVSLRQALQELLSLGIGVVGFEIELFPGTVPVLDETEDPQGVHIIA